MREPIDPKLQEAFEKHVRIVYDPGITGEYTRSVASPIRIFKTGGQTDDDLIAAMEAYRAEHGTYGSIYRQLKRGDPVGEIVFALEKSKDRPASDLPVDPSKFQIFMHEKIEEEKAARRNGTWVP